MKTKIATHGFNSRLVALLLAVMLLATLSQSGANAASPKLNATQCKQAISSFQGLYFNPNDSTPQWMDGYAVTPLISELTARRNLWKSLESKLSKGPVKSYFQDLISKSFVMLNQRDAIYKPGHTSSTGELGGSIYGITKSCVPGETNEFCKTISSTFTSVSNLWKGQSISKSGVLNTKRIWSNEVKKWPKESNSKAWLNRLLINLEEMIYEKKAGRDISGIFTIFLDEWGNTDLNNDVIDFWPCRDRALEALGVKLEDRWND
jgi:hypothetical protein